MEQVLHGITPNFEFSETEVKGVKEYIISGYISTPNLDLANDIITKSAMDDMVTQIKSGSVMLDFEHETIHSENLDINPFGRITEAKVDSKGVWVKAVLNSANRRFSEIWGSIKGGFLRAFSIAFKPLQAVTKYIEGKSVRVLDKLKLINVGLTGTPINEECSMDTVFTKAIKQLPISETEEKALRSDSLNGTSHSTSQEEDKNNMAEEETTESVSEEVKQEETAEAEAPKEAEKSESDEEAKEEAPAKEAEDEAEKPAEAEAETEVKALKAELKALKEKVAKLTADLSKPDMKAKLESAPQKQLNENAPTPLQCIN